MIGAQVLSEPRGRVLVIDDEPLVRELLVRVLIRAGFSVESASDGASAIAALDQCAFDAILSDISMPNLDGVSFLREVRRRDLDVPVILITGDPTTDTAVRALRHGALNYLSKPVDPQTVEAEVARAVQIGRLSKIRRQALDTLDLDTPRTGDRAGLEVRFGRALEELFLVFQPIICWSRREVFGFEALMRSRESSLPHPGALLDAAEALGGMRDLSRAVRRHAQDHVEILNPNEKLFVNLHPSDLNDPQLFDPTRGLGLHARRVVLEITERAQLEQVDDPKGRITRLRDLGFSVAIDDLGAGYASLTSLAMLEPDLVKIDMGLVRGVSEDPLRQKLIRAVVALCRDLGLDVIAEGVETAGERDCLLDMGCDLFQGFLFARPATPPPEPNWSA